MSTRESIKITIDKPNIELDITLAETCWNCSGGTKPPSIREEDSAICGYCHGTGLEITPEGRTILDLIELNKEVTP